MIGKGENCPKLRDVIYKSQSESLKIQLNNSTSTKKVLQDYNFVKIFPKLKFLASRRGRRKK